MKIIVGLGNPGREYEKTRHNIGFMVLDQLLKNYTSVKDTVWTDEPKFKADIAEIGWTPKHGREEKVILVKPKTYMNNSGMAVHLISSFYKVPSTDLWIIHDDADLRLGAVRIRLGGGSAGHRGIESILGHIPDGNFWRVRLGIGRPEEQASVKGIDGFVLGEFTPQDHAKVRELIPHAAKAIEEGLEEGLEVAMNRYNTK